MDDEQFEHNNFKIAKLSSLLNLETSVAKVALESCQWDYNKAIENLFSVNSSSSSSSSAPVDQEARKENLKRRRLPQTFTGNESNQERNGDASDLHVDASPPNKHQRVDLAEQYDALLNCSSEKEAAQPFAFNRYLLRSEQLRSLQWMIKQESAGVLAERSFLDEDVLAESNRVKGGILADKMGFGKTSTTIALITREWNSIKICDGKSKSLSLKNGQITSNATLIISPHHLVDQWTDEFEKFLDLSVLQIRSTPEKENLDWIKQEKCYFIFDFPINLDILGFTPEHLTTVGLESLEKCNDTLCSESLNEFKKLFAISKKWDGFSNLVVGDNKNGSFGSAASWNTTRDKNLYVRSVNSQWMQTHAILCASQKEENRPHEYEANIPQVGDQVISIYVFLHIRKGEKTWYDPVWEPFDISWEDLSYHEVEEECIINFITVWILSRYKIYLSSLDQKPLRLTKYKLTSDSRIRLKLRRKYSLKPKDRKLQQRGEGPWKLLKIYHADSLCRLNLQDFLSHHVIILSVKAFLSPVYQSILASLQNTKAHYTGDKIRRLRENIQATCVDEETTSQLLLHSPPLVQMVKWRRVVFDEFHESLGWSFSGLSKMCCVEAEYKWGLTGTPPFGDCFGIARSAVLLGYATPPENGRRQAFRETGLIGKAGSDTLHKGHRKEYFDHTAQQELKKALQVFLSRFVRQNTSQRIENIQIERHDRFIDLTKEERFIYRQACRDHGLYSITKEYEEVTQKAREELLKRCTHFDMGESISAQRAIQGLGNDKRQRVANLERQIEIESCRLKRICSYPALLSKNDLQSQVHKIVAECRNNKARDIVLKCLESDMSSNKSQPNLANSFSFEIQTPVGQHPRLKWSYQVIEFSEYYPDVKNRRFIQRHYVRTAQAEKIAKKSTCATALRILSWASEGDEDDDVEILKTLLIHGFRTLVNLFCEACRSDDFYNKQMQLILDRSSDLDVTECSICLETVTASSGLAILPCAHVFHESCVRDCLQHKGECPHCRLPTTLNQVFSVDEEIQAGNQKTCSETSDIMAHGTKLHAIAKCVQHICSDDGNAKILIFVQWEDLTDKICSSLRDYGIRFLRPRSYEILRTFQEDPTSARVLVLSLQNAAAGTNLTSANHVILVHPMNAATASQAAAYEEQALGRIRRIGQMRPTVHLWRFIASETIEEHLAKIHAQMT